MKIYSVLRMSGVGRKMEIMAASVMRIIPDKTLIVMVHFFTFIFIWKQMPELFNSHKPNDFFLPDSTEICESSSGTMSLSRCQLFEAGFLASNLYLHDPSCNGTVHDGRLVFHFDNDDHICGTNLTVLTVKFISLVFILINKIN